MVIARESTAASVDEPNHLSTERSFIGSSSFTRTIWLPRAVDVSQISAKLDHGVLTLQVPKMEDKEAVQIKID